MYIRLMHNKKKENPKNGIDNNGLLDGVSTTGYPVH